MSAIQHDLKSREKLGAALWQIEKLERVVRNHIKLERNRINMTLEKW